MRHRFRLAWLAVAAGCSFNPGAAQQALMQANSLSLQKDYAGAISYYNTALANDPTLDAAVFYRGIAYRGQGDFDQAIADINKAIEMGACGTRLLAERARTKLEKLAADSAGDKAKLAAAFAPDDPLGIGADLDKSAAQNTLNLDGISLLLHGAVRLMQNRDAEAQRDFDRFLLHRSQARADLDLAIEKWKKERPVLDLGPIDELGRIAGQRR